VGLQWYSYSGHSEKRVIETSFKEVPMARKRKHYSKEFKIDAVKLINEQGYKISEAARNLGIHHSSLRRWKDELDTNSSQAFPGKGHIRPEKEELYRLRKEVKRLRMEREILKKAAAFFAKESG
jgi:transposase